MSGRNGSAPCSINAIAVFFALANRTPRSMPSDRAVIIHAHTGRSGWAAQYQSNSCAKLNSGSRRERNDHVSQTVTCGTRRQLPVTVRREVAPKRQRGTDQLPKAQHPTKTAPSLIIEVILVDRRDYRRTPRVIAAASRLAMGGALWVVPWKATAAVGTTPPGVAGGERVGVLTQGAATALTGAEANATTWYRTAPHVVTKQAVGKAMHCHWRRLALC